MHGYYATYKWANGDVYHGYFKDGLMHGHGIYAWANGDVYREDMKDGQMQVLADTRAKRQAAPFAMESGLTISGTG